MQPFVQLLPGRWFACFYKIYFFVYLFMKHQQFFHQLVIEFGDPFSVYVKIFQQLFYHKQYSAYNIVMLVKLFNKLKIYFTVAERIIQDLLIRMHTTVNYFLNKGR